MACTLKLLLGESGSGRTAQLLTEYRAALQRHGAVRRPGRALWLAPTHRAVQGIIERLLDSSQPILLAPQVMTFDLFAEQILAAAGRPATSISSVAKRLLLRRIIGDMREREMLTSFASVAHTSGFLDVVSAFISELKREEIWPQTFLDVCSNRPERLAKRDRELGQIYERYQQHLNSQNWYDSEGRFWLARTALGEGKRNPFADVEFLAVDGFADFTRTQHEILGHLLGWISHAVMTLPHEQPPVDRELDPQSLPRPELFAKPHHTLAQIRKHLPANATYTSVPVSPDRLDIPAGIRTVGQVLFSNPRSIQVSQQAAGLEVIAATGPDGERQGVAVRIKRLLQDGIAPSQIVVAMRSVAESGSAWCDYFTEAGIPAWCEAGMPLNVSPIIKALLSVLQLEVEDWPFERLMQVLDSNYFQPNWPEVAGGRAPRDAAAALRAAKLDRGRELILRVLASIGASAGDLTVSLPAQRARSLLSRLSMATERLRRRHSLADWGSVISSLGDELGQTRGTNQIRVNLTAADRRDWELLQRIIRTAAEADRCFIAAGESSTAKERRLNLSDFLAELRDLLRAERIKADPDPGGSVRVLDVEQARHLDVAYLFLVGLAESSFPQNRADDCLFGEADRQEFARRGLTLRHREQHQRDEMFLFYSIVTRARSRLTFSYPAIDSKGQPVFSSPYVAALRSLFAPAALAVSQEGQLDPVPAGDGGMTESDLRLRSISEARAGNAALFARLSQRSEWMATGRNVLAAIEVNGHRFHERGFTLYEGRLASDFNLSMLRQRFESRHQFSATELEAYATCPYRFWLKSVLNIDEVAAPEQGTDHAARGNLIHAVLAQLLREGIDKPPDELAARFDQLVDERLAKRFHDTDLQRALTRIERRLLADFGKAFAEQQSTYFDTLRQAWSGGISSLPPETAFGSLPGAEGSTGLPHHPSLVVGTEPAEVLIRGRIDRVDVGNSQGRRVFNVIDYKTSLRPPQSSEELLKAGRGIQLALYAMAVRSLELAGHDADPFSMGYWNLRSNGFVRAFQKKSEAFAPLSPNQLDAIEKTLSRVIPELVAGIRSGKFLVENSDEDCTGQCPYRTTCRVNQIRAIAERLNKVGDILSSAEGLS